MNFPQYFDPGHPYSITSLEFKQFFPGNDNFEFLLVTLRSYLHSLGQVNWETTVTLSVELVRHTCIALKWVVNEWKLWKTKKFGGDVTFSVYRGEVCVIDNTPGRSTKRKRFLYHYFMNNLELSTYAGFETQVDSSWFISR